MLLVCLTISAFANAIYVLDQYEKITSVEDNENPYQSIISERYQTAWQDAWVNEYMVGLGEFDSENFGASRFSKQYWTFLILATFFTQIVFFNMLIAKMGTTYDNVLEHAERNMLFMRASIYNEQELVAEFAATACRNLSCKQCFKKNDNNHDKSTLFVATHVS